MLRLFLKSSPYMRMNLNRDQEIYQKISNQNLNQWLEIFKTSYTKRSVNNQKVQKVSIRRELECEKCSKTFCKIFATQNMQNQTNAKLSSNFAHIFKSTKSTLEKLNTKEDSSNTTTSKILSKICNRKHVQSNNTTFPWLKVL